MSLLINRYIFSVHLYTVYIKNYVAFFEKEKQSVPVSPLKFSEFFPRG